MPRKYQPRPQKHWTSHAVEDALAERKALNTLIRDLSKKYNIPTSSLERHLNQSINNQGRKPVYTFSSKLLLSLPKHNIIVLSSYGCFIGVLQ